MKKQILTLTIFAISAALYANTLTIAVVDFDSGNFCTVQEAAVMTDTFRNELVRSGRVDIVDRANTEALKNEMRFQMSDWVNSTRIRQAGNLLGVDYFIFGNFGIMGGTGYLQVQMTEVETGRIFHSARISLRTWNEFEHRVRALVKEFTDRIPTPDILTGTWTMPLERNRTFDIYSITFLTKTTCIITVTGTVSGERVTQEANGTYSFDGDIFRLFADFDAPVIPNLNTIQWASVLSLNEANTAFNMLIRTDNNNQTRVTFTKQ